jgi:recombinational DNA repair protein RecR
MTTTTIPLTQEDQHLLDYLLNIRRIANTKTDVFRIALRKIAEEESVKNIILATQKMEEGEILYGDIDELAKNII